MTELEYEERQSTLLGNGEFSLAGDASEEDDETEMGGEDERGSNKEQSKQVEASADEGHAESDQWDYWRAMAEAYCVDIQAATHEFANAAHEDISQKQVLDYGNCISRMPKEQPPPPPGTSAHKIEAQPSSADPGPLLKHQPAEIGAGGGPKPDLDVLEKAKPTKGLAGGAWRLHDHEVIAMVAVASELTAIASEVGR
jgi:hypothetical protein